MATKENPGAYDCYAKAEPDEPLFVLLARDESAAALVWLWCVLRELKAGNDEKKIAKAAEAREVCAQMIAWGAAKGKQVAGVGQAVLAGVMELIRTANVAVRQNFAEAGNVPTGDDFLRLVINHTPFEEPPEVTEREELLDLLRESYHSLDPATQTDLRARLANAIGDDAGGGP